MLETMGVDRERVFLLDRIYHKLDTLELPRHTVVMLAEKTRFSRNQKELDSVKTTLQSFEHGA